MPKSAQGVTYTARDMNTEDLKTIIKKPRARVRFCPHSTTPATAAENEMDIEAPKQITDNNKYQLAAAPATPKRVSDLRKEAHGPPAVARKPLPTSRQKTRRGISAPRTLLSDFERVMVMQGC